MPFNGQLQRRSASSVAKAVYGYGWAAMTLRDLNMYAARHIWEATVHVSVASV